MGKDLPTVCVFGALAINLESAGPAPDFEAREMDCRCYLTDENLKQILVHDRPNVIVTLGDIDDFQNLMHSPFDIRRKWIHVNDTTNLEQIGSGAFRCFVNDCLLPRDDAPEFVSIFTPTYKTGEDKIRRAYESIMRQTYPEWEWVIVDDSDDEGETCEFLCNLAHEDNRLSVHKQHRHSGIIGEVKNKAAMLCRGDIYIEMDHDDELTPNALADVVTAFRKYPEAGFAYTDFVELGNNGACLTYGEGWGFGYGSYRKETYNGNEWMVVNAANINPKTIRHIVAAPNHIRAWRADCYHSLGGHNRNIHVADDYEIMVRTFLATRMVRVPTLCYIQYHHQDGSNLQRVRNREIQRMVRYIRNNYDTQIHERFVELGVDDFVWNDKGYSDMNTPNPEKEQYCNFIAL
jgi:glycosyltransferase involved in cell wall biosynthesis